MGGASDMDLMCRDQHARAAGNTARNYAAGHGGLPGTVFWVKRQYHRGGGDLNEHVTMAWWRQCQVRDTETYKSVIHGILDYHD